MRKIPDWAISKMPGARSPLAVASFTDDDVYKFRMAQLLFFRHRNRKVKFGFICRTKGVNLRKYIRLADLEAQIEVIRHIRITEIELAYLRSLGEFKEEFLDFLRGIEELPPVKIWLVKKGFRIETEGPAPLVTFWETRIMRIIAQLYLEAKAAELGKTVEDLYAEGELRLLEKIEKVLASSKNIYIIDFGTRRRATFVWHERTLRILKERLGDQLVGTSNLELARRLGLKPIGTMAHEMDMVYQGIYFDEDRKAERLVSHEKMLDDWFDFYGDKFAVALPDTYGYEYFFKTFGAERGQNWKGMRHDSGPPKEFVYKHVLPFYKSIAVDSKTKSCVFSDGLRLGGELMLELAELFTDLFASLSFGVGTDITNDLGIPALSIVMKVIASCGHWVGKLSGNIEKATGRKCAVKRLKRLTGYHETFQEACTY